MVAAQAEVGRYGDKVAKVSTEPFDGQFHVEHAEA
jgi:hypothetical protein